MEIVNCTWELNNLGEKTVEITINEGDVFDKNEVLNVIKDYEYVVVKVPMNMPQFNYGLSQMGFTIIETQITISMKFKDFPWNDKLVNLIYPNYYSTKIETRDELEEVLGRMTPSMFKTDRIYLDPHFAHEQSCLRYKNWVRTEFEKGTADITKTFYRGDNVGFRMGRYQEDGMYKGLLAGIFEGYQEEGLGLLTVCACFLNAKKQNQNFRIHRSCISSNNRPMVQWCNYLNYDFYRMAYVFVRHNNDK